MLFSVGYGTGLSDHSDLDLSRISHLLLDLLGDVSGESSGLVIADLLGANNDAELAAGLGLSVFSPAMRALRSATVNAAIGVVSS